MLSPLSAIQPLSAPSLSASGAHDGSAGAAAMRPAAATGNGFAALMQRQSDQHLAELRAADQQRSAAGQAAAAPPPPASPAPRPADRPTETQAVARGHDAQPPRGAATQTAGPGDPSPAGTAAADGPATAAPDPNAAAADTAHADQSDRQAARGTGTAANATALNLATAPTRWRSGARTTQRPIAAASGQAAAGADAAPALPLATATSPAMSKSALATAQARRLARDAGKAVVVHDGQDAAAAVDAGASAGADATPAAVADATGAGAAPSDLAALRPWLQGQALVAGWTPAPPMAVTPADSRVTDGGDAAVGASPLKPDLSTAQRATDGHLKRTLSIDASRLDRADASAAAGRSAPASRWADERAGAAATSGGALAPLDAGSALPFAAALTGATQGLAAGVAVPVAVDIDTGTSASDSTTGIAIEPVAGSGVADDQAPAATGAGRRRPAGRDEATSAATITVALQPPTPTIAAVGTAPGAPATTSAATAAAAAAAPAAPGGASALRPVEAMPAAVDLRRLGGRQSAGVAGGDASAVAGESAADERSASAADTDLGAAEPLRTPAHAAPQPAPAALPGAAALAAQAGGNAALRSHEPWREGDRTTPLAAASGSDPAAAVGSGAAVAALASPGLNAASAAAAPVAARIAPALDSPAFAPALGAQLSLFARDGVQTASLQLNPAEMGPIAVQIAVEGGAARVTFQADLASTREVIEASLPALASALQDAGLTLTGGGVFQQQPGRQQQPDPATPAPAWRTADRGGPADSALGSVAARDLRPSRGLVDLVA